MLRSLLVPALAFSLAAPPARAEAAGDQRLVEAARNRDAAAVAALLKAKVDPNSAQPDGGTALHWAAQWDDLATAKLLVAARATVDVANDYGMTPLSLAATNGSQAMIELLLKGGARVNGALRSGETPLMTAARTGNVQAVKVLIAAGANLNATETAKGQSALMWAVAERHGDVVRTLIEAGADIQAASSSGFTPLLFAVRMGDIELVRLFLDKGMDIEGAAKDGSTPLAIATVRGHVALAEWLLDRGADPNRDSIGYTPLHWAAGTFDTMSTKEYTPEEGEWSALAGIPDRAAKKHLILALLAKGANINARVRGRLPRFGYSLGGGSVVGGGSHSGATPFFLASTVGDMDTMRLLLAHGANPSIATNDGTTPLMATAGISIVEAETSTTEEKLLEALKLTIQLGNDMKAANDAGTTALHATAYVGFNVIAKFLIDQGVAMNQKDKRGQTPLKIASGIPMSGMFYAQPKTAELLRSLGATE